MPSSEASHKMPSLLRRRLKHLVLLAASLFMVAMLFGRDPELGRREEERRRKAFREEEDEAFGEVMEERRARIQNTCRQAGGDDYRPVAFLSNVSDPRYRNRVYLDRNRGILYCPVYKAATTTWLNNFILLHEETTMEEKAALRKRLKDHTNEVATKLYPRASEDESTTLRLGDGGPITKFLIVRHPFDRLVSAYRDKFERVLVGGRDGDWFYKSFGRQMVSDYREAAIEHLGENFFSPSNNYGAPLPVTKERGFRNSKLPVFWEFVQFLLEKVDQTPNFKSSIAKYCRDKYNNEHWCTVQHFCRPCEVEFDFVLKFETLAEEEPTFKRVLELEEDLSRQQREAEGTTAKYRNQNQPDQLTGDQLTKLYFSQLREEDVRGLFEIYREDFEMFGYTFTFGDLTLP